LKNRRPSLEHNGIDGDSIVIAIDIAYIADRTGKFRPTFGIFYELNSEINVSAPLPYNLKQNTRIAEMYAAFHLLKVIQDILQPAQVGV